jgi:hypothetical protein
MDAFDTFWQWANKPLDSHATIPAELHHAVTSLPEETGTLADTAQGSPHERPCH